jgi:GntR family transcriptional regulator
LLDIVIVAQLAAGLGIGATWALARLLVGWADDTNRMDPRSLSDGLMKRTMSKLLKAYDRSRIPLYIQVAAIMRQRIERQQWRPGQKISTLVELEREFEVARVTVRQAVDILRQEGLLHCHQGRGTFVAEKPPSRHWLELATDWAILIDSIKDNVPKRIRVENPPAFPKLHEGEGTLAPEYRFIRSLQYKDGEPYSIVSVHLARAVFDRDPEAFLTRPALAILASFADIEVQHAYQTIVIGGASVQTADLLKIALGAPTAECRCVVIDGNGVAIYVADMTYRSEVVRLHIDLLAHATPSPASATVAAPRGAALAATPR